MGNPKETPATVMSIVKPTNDPLLEKFRSKKEPTIAGVGENAESLPVLRMAEVRDFFMLHPDEELYWGPELCFVKVPIVGQNRDLVHMIDEDIAVKYLASGKIMRYRLALASKPNDVFFLCHLPTRNLDNPWNHAVLKAAVQAKQQWIEVTSRKDEKKEDYEVTFAQDMDAFPDPKWPTESLGVIIINSFAGHSIETEDHPALLRLIGKKQNLKSVK